MASAHPIGIAGTSPAETPSAGSDNHRRLALETLKKFRLIYGSVRQHFRDIEQSCGISGSQLWILRELAEDPAAGVSALAARLSIHQSTCSQLVEKLVARGLVVKERQREDQRRVVLTLSAEARRILAAAPGPAEGILPDALMALPAEALRQLDASLEEVIGQLQGRDDRLAHKPLADL